MEQCENARGFLRELDTSVSLSPFEKARKWQGNGWLMINRHLKRMLSRSLMGSKLGLDGSSEIGRICWPG